MSTVSVPTGQSLVLSNVDWRTYSRLVRALDERPGLRLTYDRGTLEIMTLTYGHENWAYILGRFIDVLTEELGLPISGGGSTTFRRRPRRRGLEPDQCFWIVNEPRVRGKARIDLRVDPPPDLVIEVDITSSSLDRMAIYAALGMPEVWRYDGQTLAFQVLGPNRQYAAATHSRAFPQITSADVAAVLSLRGQMDVNGMVRQFRTWLRQRSAGGTAPSP